MRLPYLLIFNLLALAIFGQTNDQDDTESLNRRWNEANRAYADEDFEKAQTAAVSVVEQIPYEPSSRILLARCLARTGKLDDAIKSLEIAADLGWEDVDQIRNDAAFRHLRESSKFSVVLERYQSNRKLEFVLYEGKLTRPDRPAPLVVLFHGRGELPGIQLHFWKQAADQGAFRVLALKGTTRLGNVYVWERSGATKTWQVDIDAIQQETQKRIAQVTKTHKTSDVLLAGFSQGGVAAIEMQRRELNPRPVGTIVFATAFPTNAKELDVSEKDSHLPLIVHIGTGDRWLEGNRLFAKLVRRVGGQIEFRQWEKLGHQMPAGYTQVILKAVQNLLHREETDKR